MTKSELDNWFTYHAPNLEQAKKYETIRTAARFFAQVIVDNTPQGADQSAAIRSLRECTMTANAAIACEEQTNFVAQSQPFEAEEERARRRH